MNTTTKPLNKSDIAKHLQDTHQLSKKDSSQYVDYFLNAITELLPQAGKIAIVGFGTFSIHEREARTGRNPRTGEKMEIPATKSVKFTAGSVLTEACKKVAVTKHQATKTK